MKELSLFDPDQRPGSEIKKGTHRENDNNKDDDNNETEENSFLAVVTDAEGNPIDVKDLGHEAATQILKKQKEGEQEALNKKLDQLAKQADDEEWKIVQANLEEDREELYKMYHGNQKKP